MGAAQARHGGHVRGDGRGAAVRAWFNRRAGTQRCRRALSVAMINSITIAMQARNCSSKHESRFGCEVLENLPLATRNDVARSRTQKNIQFSHTILILFFIEILILLNTCDSRNPTRRSLPVQSRQVASAVTSCNQLAGGKMSVNLPVSLAQTGFPLSRATRAAAARCRAGRSADGATQLLPSRNSSRAVLPPQFRAPQFLSSVASAWRGL